MKASFYKCPECQKVFIREGQRHSIKSSCTKCDKAHIVCRRVYKMVHVCGAERHSTYANTETWICECGNPQRWKRETPTL